jgi:hypothetical protein
MTKNDKPSGKRQENDKQNDKFASCQNGAFLKKLSFFVICHLCLRFFQTCHFFYKQNDTRKLKLQKTYFVFFQALAGQESSKARLMGNAPPRAQLRDADQNQDGMLSLAEFREAWKKKA